MPKKLTMLEEIFQIPTVIANLAVEGIPIYQAIGKKLSDINPQYFVTCARGTSDNAVTYFKYLIESKCGIPLASIGPSIASIYKTPLRLKNSVCLTVSQSGTSPDLIALQKQAKTGESFTIALVNNTNSIIAQNAECVIPMLSGKESAIAATKTYVSSLFALTAVFAGMTNDKELLKNLYSLPEYLVKALRTDWSEAYKFLSRDASFFSISRGLGLSLSNESALKFKETCRLHAESYSSAEFQHGPMALAEKGFSAFVFVPDDECNKSVLSCVDKIISLEAKAIIVSSTQSNNSSICHLDAVKAPHPLLTTICQAVSFYVFADGLAKHLGENPDNPPHLKKETTTT